MKLSHVDEIMTFKCDINENRGTLQLVEKMSNLVNIAIQNFVYLCISNLVDFVFT